MPADRRQEGAVGDVPVGRAARGFVLKEKP